MRSVALRCRRFAGGLAAVALLGGLAGLPRFSFAAPAVFQPVRGMMLLGGRVEYAMAVLPSGNVLIAGGLTGVLGTTDTDTAEIYNPKTGRFTLSRGRMTVRRAKASVTVLPNGKVLIAGGQNDKGILQTADLYDPATDSFAQTGTPMTIARIGHTATLLKDGTVLIAGGTGPNADPLDTAEIYNPATDAFTALANHLTTPRSDATAALLGDGEVLIAGGGKDSFASAETYDPVSMSFTATAGPMTAERILATATTLTTGEVLIAGGTFKFTNLASTELYDPETRQFSAGPTMSSPRIGHFAVALPSGQVLIGGGFTDLFSAPTATVDLFDPATATFRPTSEPLHIARSLQVAPGAVLLPDGKVLVMGGFDNQGNLSGLPLPAGEIYDPALDSFSVTGALNAPRTGHTATLLRNGKVLIAGGANGAGNIQTSAELYDPRSDRFDPTAGPLNTPRVGHAAARLADGRVLIAGGAGEATAEVYDPATDRFTITAAPMTTARVAETATLLADGRLLIAGGIDDSGHGLSSAELYDPRSDSFAPTRGSMTTPRAIHSAVRLGNGKVLIVGGSTDGNLAHALASAELYDPRTQTFSAVRPMADERAGAAALLLGDGRVLVAGGIDRALKVEDTAELFDPASGGFSTLASTMSSPRLFHSATLLKGGTVLLAGGDFDLDNSTAGTDLYNPRTRTFKAGPPMTVQRDFQTAVRLRDGRVLIAGGRALIGGGASTWPTAEIFTP